ncbi:MAG: hypothetical protein HQM08_27015 [Candidatus Riflebacteria bacterium]|nr:hypothetical protein [Candidatus Riflebacteria bacterium]
MKKNFESFFKWLFFGFFIFSCSLLSADTSFEFTGDSKVNLDDVIIAWAFSQVQSDKIDFGDTTPITISDVQRASELIYPSLKTRGIQVQRVPSLEVDDITGNGKIDLNDAIFAWAYSQVQSDKTDFGDTTPIILEDVQKAGELIYPALKTSSDKLQVLPMTELSSNTVEISIGGITTE